MENQENSNILDEQGTNPIVDSTPNQEDIFDQVFNMKSDDPFAANLETQVTEEPVVESEPLSTQTMIEAKSDPNQFEYWQSQADKRSQEIGALKQELESIKTSMTKEEPVKETKPEIVKPVKPVKPADYNHSEALADPDSPSAKYLEQNQAYLESMNDYILERDSQRDAEIAAAEAQRQALQQQQDTINTLQANFGYTPDMADNFIKTMSSPESLSLENLVKLHQLNIGANAPQANQVSPQAQQRQAQLQQRQDKLGIPKPIGVQPGVSVQSPKASTEDELMNAMINEHKKVNPW